MPMSSSPARSLVWLDEIETRVTIAARVNHHLMLMGHLRVARKNA
jgi:hypothetical protein